MAAGGTRSSTYPPFPMTATKTTMVAGLTGGTAVRRIRSPNPQDVLSGRGGGINSHKGNKAFREWVNQRKEEYNLAQNKKEKIAVAMQVVRQVQNQVPVPGRFLQRDPTAMGGSSGQWWVEIDEAKALAKTTQALREGAPKIRQAHRNADNSPQKSSRKAKTRKRKAPLVAKATETPMMDDDTEKLVLQTVKQDASSLPRYKSEQLLLPTTDYSVAIEQLQENVEKAKHQADERQHQQQALRPQTTTLVAPLTSNKAFNAMYGQQKVAVGQKPSYNPLAMPAVDPFAETPPLMAAPEPDIANDIPVLSLDNGRSIQVEDIGANPSPPKKVKLHRVHSLALSDVDGTNNDELIEFVNPFADETDVIASENDPNVVKAHVPSSVFNSWNKNIVQDTNSIADQSKLSRSIGGYLNRLLSFSSASADSDDTEALNFESNNNDYFFHDDIPECDFGEGMKSAFDVVHPEASSEKNSTSSLSRLTSFSSRNRGLVNGRE